MSLIIKYIFASPSLKGSSVQTKVQTQINSLIKSGANCRGVFFSTEVITIEKWDENIDFYPVERCNWKYFKHLGQRLYLSRAIRSYIKREYSKTNYFYIRYVGGSYNMYRISLKFGDKIVSEHQSKEVEEIESFKHLHPFGLRPSKLFSWFQYYAFPLMNEKIWGDSYIRNINLVVSVTKEILEYQKNKGAKNSIVVANGINVNDYKLRNQPDFELPLKILFLKGTSTDAPWNGLERIINSIDKYIGKKNIELIICGHYIQGEIPIKSYIKHLGYLNKEQVDKLMDEVHIGFSTMALYKQGLQEASSLKTREYISRGLPFIYAYNDTDLNKDSEEFTFKFQNDESLIDMEKVVGFAKRVLNDKEMPGKMRKYSEGHLDYDVKMKRLLYNLNAL